MSNRKFKRLIAALSCAIVIPNNYAQAENPVASDNTRTLILGAYTTPREAYNKAIIPAFQNYWRKKTGQQVEFQTSYLGSGAQARAIISGFEADVAALSLEDDIDNIAQAGLISSDWKATPYQGMVTRSIVVIAVRPQNPKQIYDWDDLKRVSVLTPDIRTSGGAMWNICALYGAAMRGATSATKQDSASATKLLQDVLHNVTIMDKGARESIINFERGIGDAAITYENEVIIGRKFGKDYEYVIPKATILIENPAAVISEYADKHQTRDLAEAFVHYLTTPEAQQAFMEYGLRPVIDLPAPSVEKFKPVQDIFTIRDLGGWAKVKALLFAPGAIYDQVMAVARQ